MHKRIAITAIIIMGAVLLSGCNSQVDARGGFSGISKAGLDLAQSNFHADSRLNSSAAQATSTLNSNTFGPLDAGGSGNEALFQVQDGPTATWTPSPTPTPTPTNTPNPDGTFVFAGQVQSISPDYWTVDDTLLRVTEETVFYGNIDIDDWVKVTASRVGGGGGGPLIALEISYFGTPVPEFIGQVYEITEKQWVIGDFRVRIIEDHILSTEIIGDVREGDFVQVISTYWVEGVVNAIEIRFVERPVGTGEYFGRVYEMDGPIWLIGNNHFSVDEQTEIEGAVVRGDLVKVYSDQFPDGSLYALKIQLLDGFPPFEKVQLKGLVFRIEPERWVVGTTGVWITEHTKIHEGIQVDDWAEVSGYYEYPNSDLYVIALEINPIEGPAEDVVFQGQVEEMSADVWIIKGIQVLIDEETVIIGDSLGHIHLGDYVEVHGNLESNGSVGALEIRLRERMIEKIEFDGRVKHIDGYLWSIGDYPVEVNEHTEIIGNIDVGDLVHVEGNLYLDGVVEADRIKLLKKAQPDREVEFTARVKEIGQFMWIIGAERVMVTRQTEIIGEIEVGDLVRVRGVRWIGDIVLARQIELLDRDPPYEEVEFRGVVERMSDRIWVVAGRRVLVNARTKIVGNIQVGDLVYVRGIPLFEDAVVALEIRLLEDPVDDREVEFTGRVKEIGERIWVIADHRVLVTERTVITGDIEVGDMVKVRGVQRDGAIVALEINLIEPPPQEVVVEFTDRVKEMGDRIWLIGDYRVRITERTEIVGEIGVRDLVHVRGLVGDDGLVIAIKITLVEKWQPPVEEVEFEGRVGWIGDRAWMIAQRRVLVTEETKIEGEISVGDIVSVKGYINDNGVIVAVEILLLEPAPDRDRDFPHNERRDTSN